MSNEIQPLSPQEVDTLEQQMLVGVARRLLATVRDRERHGQIELDARRKAQEERDDWKERVDQLQQEYRAGVVSKDECPYCKADAGEQEGKE